MDRTFPRMRVAEPICQSPSSSSNQTPTMQSPSSASYHYPILESNAYSNQNPLMEPFSSSSCFWRSNYNNHRFTQNRASLTPTFGLHSLNDPSSSHQDLTSLLASLNLSDMGSYSNLLLSCAPSPSLPFDNGPLYHSHIRTQEAFAPQMASSSSSSPLRDYHQSVASPQFRNIFESCLRVSATSRSLQSDYDRRSTPSNSRLGYSARNRPPLSSNRMYAEFGNLGSRRFRMSAAVFDSGVENLRGLIFDLAKDQEGCRYLQKKIEGGMASDIGIIFSEVKDRIRELMIDPFGNYFVQRLFEACNKEQRTEIILVVTQDQYELLNICLDTHGTRAVQKLLDHLTTPNQIKLVISTLRPGTLDLINHVNGHHVVERCLQSFPHEYNKCLTDKIADHCVDIAMHPNGCCALQKCLGFSEGEQRERLLSEIIVNALLLSQDKFGNYIVQFVLETIPHVTASIVEQLKGNYASLSMQKFSSNVVEKCLNLAQEEQSTMIVRELLESAVLIMQDAFGNYVMQSALKVSKGPIYHAIVNLVERELPALSSHPFGEWVVAAAKLV